MTTSEHIGIIGLGYVGLPLAVAFAEGGHAVVGFDVNERKIEQLRNGVDPTGDIGNDRLRSVAIKYSTNPEDLQTCRVFIVTVPTPLTLDNMPDLSFVHGAMKIVGSVLQPGSLVVLESTVYPGATEEECIPILEQESGLQHGDDFVVGYSPERIVPGDHEHTLKTVIKVVAGDSPETAQRVKQLYSTICPAGVFVAASIKVAEAEKVVENIQRDLNIALMNELAMIFYHLDIDTQDVLQAAGTKWNFHHYFPGLVGGHCIGVDPQYLIQKSRQHGYLPEYIMAGRALNEQMSAVIVDRILSQFTEEQRSEELHAIVLGASFKENVADYRNSKVSDVVGHLENTGVTVSIIDPLAHNGDFSQHFGQSAVEFASVAKAHMILYMVPHNEFKSITLEQLATKAYPGCVLFDLRRQYDKQQAQAAGFNYLSL